MFGKDLQLKCNIKCCLRNVTTSAFWEMEWPNGTVETISVDELSLKPSKYEILVGNDGYDQAVWVQREINIVLASAIITLFTLLILMIWTCWEKDFRYFRDWLLLLYFTWAEQNPLPGGIRGILYNEYPHNTSASTAIKVEADQLSESESQPLIV
ncbi:unnamed protein product [Mytilus edulis]|uniref:Uncharacterized protein n=1 Tax=Mytilus edulis TaxID=6550 RepID=A0A8S3R5H9_MYTED|nr:unnamed protein product [Mytilus edulis]